MVLCCVLVAIARPADVPSFAIIWAEHIRSFDVRRGNVVCLQNFCYRGVQPRGLVKLLDESAEHIVKEVAI